MERLKEGDIVTPAEGNKQYIASLAGGKFDRYRITKVTHNLVEAMAVTENPNATGGFVKVFDFRFEKVKPKPKRVEGKRIEPEDVKVGDLILVHLEEGKLISTHEAVVESIDLFNGTLGFRSGNELINWPHKSGEVITLIEAVPEVDELLEKMKNAPDGQIIQFRGFLARKGVACQKWDVYRSNGLKVYSTEDLREIVHPNEVRFYKVEG